MTVVELARSARGPLAVLAGFGLVFVSLLVARAPLDAATVSLAVCGGTLVYALRRMFLLARALARPDSLAQVGRGAGSFTVAELRDEKRRLLRAIKELEFDYGMGKLSQADYEAVIATYKLRAIEVMRALQGGADLHPELQRLLDQRAQARGEPPAPGSLVEVSDRPAFMDVTSRICGHCSGNNENDARFCKHCGVSLVKEAPPAPAPVVVTASGELSDPEPTERRA